MRTLPLLAILLGAAGLLPFIGGSLGALGPFTGETRRIAMLGLSAYGAVILSFLGAVHWGLALQAGTGQARRTQSLRFGLGVVPALIGWAALLITYVGLIKTGLLILVAGFVAVTILEARAARVGLVPVPYMGLRWVLSLVVVVCLVSVCLVSALGGTISI